MSAAEASDAKREGAPRIKLRPPLDGESPRAYAAFCIYMTLGERRSIGEAWRIYAERYKLKSKDGKHTGAFTIWARDFRWREEAMEADRVLFEAKLEARSEQRERAYQVAFDAAVEMAEILIDLARNASSEQVRLRAARHALALAHVIPPRSVEEDEDEDGTEEGKRADKVLALLSIDDLRALTATPAPATPPNVVAVPAQDAA